MKKKLSMSVINLIVCGIGVIAFVAVAIYPTYRSIAAMDKDIEKLSADIEAQKLLIPVFMQLLKKSREKKTPLLPSPPPVRLQRGNTGAVSETIQKTAQEHRLTIESLTPDVQSMIGGSDHLKMNAHLRGMFPDIRGFLIGLGEIPSLDFIERISMQTVKGAGEIQVELILWLAQE